MIKMVLKSLETFQTTKSEVFKTLEDMQKLQPVFHDVQAIRNIKDLDKLLEDDPKINMVLNFWGEYCGKCKAFFPIFESLCKRFYKDFIFVKLDIEHDIRISHRYKITSIPTQIIIKNGSLVYKHVGVIDYKSLEEKIERYKSF
ncbi:hypothetical protein LCGC14_1021220 [marine sediment metagenome]|uniref:Thioredoxin domain-containing protein n=1 Tax=marine sediment metagenome TaxID=412755 RepID=A0A0F9N1W0_9ZZZZ